MQQLSTCWPRGALSCQRLTRPPLNPSPLRQATAVRADIEAYARKTARHATGGSGGRERQPRESQKAAASAFAAAIRTHQSPADLAGGCTRARLCAITKEHTAGLGSQLNVLAGQLLWAMREGCVLVQAPSLRLSMVNPRACAAQRWECYFEPLSLCQAAADAAPAGSVRAVSGEWQVVSHVGHAREAYGLRSELRITAELLRYVMRPNARLARAIDGWRGELRLGSEDGASPPRVAVHVRHGDKREGDRHSNVCYVRYAQRAAQVLGATVVHLSSDDPAAYAAFEALEARPMRVAAIPLDAFLHSADSEDHHAAFAFYRRSKERAGVNSTVDWPKDKDDGVTLLATLFLMAEAEFVVAKFSSNWGRLLYPMAAWRHWPPRPLLDINANTWFSGAYPSRPKFHEGVCGCACPGCARGDCRSDRAIALDNLAWWTQSGLHYDVHTTDMSAALIHAEAKKTRTDAIATPALWDEARCGAIAGAAAAIQHAATTGSTFGGDVSDAAIASFQGATEALTSESATEYAHKTGWAKVREDAPTGATAISLIERAVADHQSPESCSGAQKCVAVCEAGASATDCLASLPWHLLTALEEGCVLSLVEGSPLAALIQPLTPCGDISADVAEVEEISRPKPYRGLRYARRRFKVASELAIAAGALRYALRPSSTLAKTLDAREREAYGDTAGLRVGVRLSSNASGGSRHEDQCATATALRLAMILGAESVGVSAPDDAAHAFVAEAAAGTLRVGRLATSGAEPRGEYERVLTETLLLARADVLVGRVNEPPDRLALVASAAHGRAGWPPHWHDLNGALWHAAASHAARPVFHEDNCGCLCPSCTLRFTCGYQGPDRVGVEGVIGWRKACSRSLS